MRKNKKQVKKSMKEPRQKASAKTASTCVITFDSLEYFRDAYCLLRADKKDVICTYSFPALQENAHSARTDFCSCNTYQKKRKKCEHISSLRDLLKRATGKNAYYNYNSLEKTLWYKVAKMLSEVDQCIVSSSKLKEENAPSLTLYNNMLLPVIHYHGLTQGDRQRFKERLTEKQTTIPRGKILKQLFSSFLSEDEQKIVDSGYITPRLVFEQSIWFRFAYHLHNEFQDSAKFMVSTDQHGQSFQLNGFIGKEKIFDCSLPQKLHDKIIAALNEHMITELPKNIKKLKGYPSCSLQLNNSGGIRFQPILKTVDESGNEKTHKVNHLPSGKHKVFMHKIGLIDLQPAPNGHTIPTSPAQTVPPAKIPEFITKCSTHFLNETSYDIDPAIRKLRVYETPEEFHIQANTIDKEWCDFNFHLPFGTSDIPLYDIIHARQAKNRYIKIQNGWIDSRSSSLNKIINVIDFETGSNFNDEHIRLSKIEFLRFLSMLPTQVKAKTGDAKEAFENFIQLKPSHTDFDLKTLNCTLRHYQELGLQWLTFLAENQFGGLLCDDMGLGKTHQLMALMTLFVEKRNEKKPFLVVCPTTVISHWQDKISRFAPALNALVYHGQERDINMDFKAGSVILTSYGIIRNDIKTLSEIDFSIAVFDEIQNLKNKQTKSYQAIKELTFSQGIGLSGTPIENRLSELKALMDIVLPGYLGSDHKFTQNYIKPIEDQENNKAQQRLHKMVSPFILRRLKTTVLDELPPKIEDIRTCKLSPEQVTLYRKTLATQGQELRKQLEKSKSDKEIPYIHIFALLGLLKQICNHPALVEDIPEHYQQRESGKWDIFKEILNECLGSDNKVVVFTQFLGMIDIMSRYLKEQDIHFVTLTGKSRKRGEIINEFNNNENCKVFLGSLKAGGTGIDLVAASVVIHYDRWWNAAKEDQATDRVHRIGQTRGVQVFKFVTKDTLEEKIAAIIEKKRKLMNSIVKEDSADSLKTFTKEELFDLLAAPQA